jgi:diadenosine tetraphosphate (Ap4A) HIT family hydrolase
MGRRFQWILDGQANGPDPHCDVALLTSADGVVIPSVGSLVPGWSLIVPRQPALSYTDLDKGLRKRLRELADVAAERVRIFGSPAFFEHGSVAPASVVGCGVDQAHLHVVPLGFDLIEKAQRDSSVAWTSVPVSDPWECVPQGEEYYLVMSANHALIGKPTRPESQYFRKQIAAGIGHAEQWDYKGWPNYGNAARTIDCFQLRRAA